MNCIWVLSVFQFNQNLFVCRSFIMFSENSMLFSCGRVWIEANSRDLDQGTPRVCIPSYLGRCQCQGGWWERLGHCLRSCPWRLEWVWFIFEIALGRKMTQVNPINRCFLDLFGGEDILHAALLAPTSTWYHGIHGWWIFPGDQVEGVAIQALKLPCRPLKRLRQPAVVNARFGPFVQIRSCWRPMLRVWDVVLWEMYLEIEGTFFILFFCWHRHSRLDWNSCVCVRVKWAELVVGNQQLRGLRWRILPGPRSSYAIRAMWTSRWGALGESGEYNSDGVLFDRFIFHDIYQTAFAPPPHSTCDRWWNWLNPGGEKSA